MDYQYPKGAVMALLPTHFVTDATIKGLKGISETAQLAFNKNFIGLTDNQQVDS